MPTVLRLKGFRFFFFSREELRMHIHVQHQNGEAKFWLDPQIELAKATSPLPKNLLRQRP
jgi:hypothetical protein